MPEHSCAYCGKTFVGRKGRKYCSRLCHYTAVTTQRQTYTCKTCGKTFEGYGVRTYCSRKCATSNPTTCQRIASSLTGKSLTPEHKMSISNAMKTRVFTEEHRRRLSAAAKRQWARRSEEERQAIIDNWSRSGAKASMQSSVSKLEDDVAAAFDEMAISYQRQVSIGRYFADFVLFDVIVVEVDGTYWHGRPGDEARQRIRDARLSNAGYAVIHLDEEDLRRDMIGTIITKVFTILTP